MPLIFAIAMKAPSWLLLLPPSKGGSVAEAEAMVNSVAIVAVPWVKVWQFLLSPLGFG